MSPKEVEAYNRLGGAHRRLGRIEAAISAFSTAKSISPNNWTSYHNLASTLKQQGRIAEAAREFEQALKLKPDLFEVAFGYATCLHELQRFQEASRAYALSVRLRPDFGAFINLGNVFLKLEQTDRACVAYRRAIELRPDSAMAHASLASALLRASRPGEACAAFRVALVFDRKLPEVWHGLALGLRGVGRLTECIDAFKEAVELDPDSAEIRNNYGNVLREMGQMGVACNEYERALMLRPDYAEAVTNLATGRKDQGRLSEAIELYERALAAKPDLPVIEGNLVYAMSYVPGMTLKRLYDAHTAWNDHHAAKFKDIWPQSHSRPRNRASPRIGFVSSDFLHHPVGYFIIQLLETLKKKGVNFFCYANQTREDALTARFRATAHAWRSIAGLSDDAAADQVRADEIDILFDMSGFMAGNRLLLFARKPAPIQVSWFGYMATTGLEAIDYILADRYHIPVASERYYRERVVRLPDSLVCFDPPPEAPDVTPLPGLNNGYVTFGSFNVLCKLNPDVIGLWARILNRVPNSKLLLKTGAFSCPATRQYYIDMFAQIGVTADRLELLGKTPRRQHMEAIARCDIALDPFPYLGCTTTAESVWMGVPVIARPGELFSSRHSLSLLSSVGYTETIVTDLEAYVEKAVELAADLPRLAKLRGSLRSQIKSSSLCDAEKFTTNFEKACGRMWEIYRSGSDPFGFSMD